MTFQEEVKILSNISMSLIENLEPEPTYVKKFIKEVCEEIQEKGFLKQEEDRTWKWIFKKDKYTLKIAFVHARKGEHITGADLVFELKNKKIVFIQSKRVGRDGRIRFDRFQLQKLIELEGQICGLFPFYSYFPILPFLVPLYYLTFRAAFYHLIMTNQGKIEERFFHTSEVYFTLAGNKSVSQKEFLNHGLKSDEFKRMFWECKIGGPDTREDIKKDILYLYSLLTNRLIIWLHVEES